MRDPVLARLLDAIDDAPSALLSEVEEGDVAVARARLAAAQRHLGNAVQESPYLAFARRTVVRLTPDRFAASA